MSLADKIYWSRYTAARKALEAQARAAGIIKDRRYVGADRYGKRQAPAPGSEAARVYNSGRY